MTLCGKAWFVSFMWESYCFSFPAKGNGDSGCFNPSRIRLQAMWLMLVAGTRKLTTTAEEETSGCEAVLIHVEMSTHLRCTQRDGRHGLGSF